MAVTTLDFPTIEVKNQGILPRAALYIGRNGYIPRWSGLSSLIESKIYDDGTTLRFETLSGTSPSSNYLTVDTSGNVIPTSIPSISTGNLTSTDITVSGGTGAVVGAGTSLTLATVNANTGTWGSATQVPQFTVNGKGLITAVSNVTITPAASSITGGQALTKVDDTNVTLTLGGTPSTALLQSTSLTLGWTGQLSVSRGGTGTGTTFTQGSVIFAGALGVYSQNNSHFFWDNTNNRLGIGTNTSLGAKLHISNNSGTATNKLFRADGSSSNMFYIQENGYTELSTRLGIRNNNTTFNAGLTIGNTNNWLGNVGDEGIYINEDDGILQPQLAMGCLVNNATYEPLIAFYRARGTFAAASDTQSGDNIGSITFNTRYLGVRRNIVKYGAVSLGSYDSRFFITTNISGALTETLTVLSSGGVAAVGIANTSPVAKLDVISTTEQFRLRYDSSNYFKTTVASNANTTFDLVASAGTPNFIFSKSINIADTNNLIFSTTTGTKIGTATSQKIGFWNATPIIQPASANQAALTNSTGGSYDATLVDVSTVGIADPAKINDNFTDIYTLLNEIRSALVNSGLIKGSA